jgi:inositol-1,3,4-trisphosphate 5/6-kinase/inositol-tetrakisphosphate 1-kinase
MSLSEIEQQVAHLRFPMIFKPLVAAGAKASHAMTVLMDRSALSTVADKAPCLCQEYSNHDAVLHKVYVLGDYVSVHRRRSLPNLPRNRPSRRSFVEFDSQRPYPRLIDFGYDNDGRHQETGSPGSIAGNGKPTSVTIEEVKPIVTALKEAFGLELFGFDILVVSAGNSSSSDTNHHRKMLVVDVNYFPSYKEVTNFPTLLAKYLTDRAVANRRRAAVVSALRTSSDANPPSQEVL